MKNKTYFIAICAVFLIPFSAPGEGGRQMAGDCAIEGIHLDKAPARRLAGASFMPVLDTDMSDLEVRDAQNRVVKNARSTQELTELFINNLFNLTVVSNLHGITQIWNDLQLFSRLFRGLIFNVFYPLVQALTEALQPPTKRFVHNVGNLWITIVVGILLSTFLLANLFQKPSHQRLILRC